MWCLCCMRWLALQLLPATTMTALRLVGAARSQRETSELRASAHTVEEEVAIETRSATDLEGGQVVDLMEEGATLEPSAAMQLARSVLDQLTTT